MHRKWHRHVGVYGICLHPDQSRILLIKKAKGPYKGLYDLPGGGIKNNEMIEEALMREMIEETGVEVKHYQCLGVYDFLIEYNYLDTMFTHHIACFYLIEESIEVNCSRFISDMVYDGEYVEYNDSSGFEYVELKHLNQHNSSPLVLKAIECLHGGKLNS